VRSCATAPPSGAHHRGEHLGHLRARRGRRGRQVRPVDIGATLLTLATLGLVRVLRNRLKHWSANREQLSFSAQPGFGLEPVVAPIHKEGGNLRGLEHEQGDDGDRVAILVRFPPRYQIERFIETLSQIPGVREVEWEG
jgi:uncharacterized membrane protein YhiD involved in acid resistance